MSKYLATYLFEFDEGDFSADVAAKFMLNEEKQGRSENSLWELGTDIELIDIKVDIENSK